MIKKVFSRLFVIAGTLLILASVGLFVYNNNVESNLQMMNESIVDILKNNVGDLFDLDNTNDNNDNQLSVGNSNHEVVKTEDEILIDGYAYTAWIEIETLGLVLPIQSSWSYPKLDVSLCMYKTARPMSIAGHNFKAHFGKLHSLKPGDKATLNFLSGKVMKLEVVSVTKIHETDIDEFEDGEYDLTLFTCNYINDDERIVVRLNEID